MTSNSDNMLSNRFVERAGAITRKRNGLSIKLLTGALVVSSICIGVAACDTRSNKDLNGIATWPMGGPAHGAWQDSPPPTTSSTETTTTTTTIRQGSR